MSSVSAEKLATALRKKYPEAALVDERDLEAAKIITAGVPLTIRGCGRQMC